MSLVRIDLGSGQRGPDLRPGFHKKHLIIEGHRRSWKVVEGQGRTREVMEGQGRSRKVMDGLFP